MAELSFGRLLRGHRTRARLSQDELAELTGVSARAVRDLESGRVRRPRNETVRLLAGALRLAGADRDAFDRAAAVAEHDESRRPEAAPIPRQLPPDVGGFVGRAAEAAELDRLLSDGGPTVAVVTGAAGNGKTAFVVHWAHRVAKLFPDGQLHANLHGYDSAAAVSPVDVLSRFLRALGAAPDTVPAELDEAAALFRSLVADRRLLVVLDNAAGVRQVRPLLPAGTGCRAVVTSRDALSGLVAREGAHRVPLDVLAAAESLELLRNVLGADRVAAEVAATTELADACGHLPLALRIAATHLVDHPHRRIAEYRSELVGEERLTMLRVAGDPDTAVRAAFDVSYRAIDPALRRTFRLVGLVHGPDFAVPTAAAVTGLTPARVVEHLDALVGAHLLQRPASGRYGLHDLLRLYARDVVQTDETDLERLAAIGRMLDELVGATVAAARFIDHNLGRLPIEAPPPTGAAPTDVAAAVAWLETEGAGLRGALDLAARNGFDERAWQLAGALFVFNVRGGSTAEEFTTVHRVGLAAARRSGNRAAEAAMRNGLAGVHWRSGRYPDAIAELTTALRLRTALGDHNGVGRTLTNLGAVQDVLGRYGDALTSYGEALAAFVATDDLQGQIAVLNNLGLVHRRLGQDRQALLAFERGLALADTAGFRHGRGMLLGGLGATEAKLGRLDDAMAHLTEAVRLRRECGDRTGAAAALNDLAVTHRLLGRLDDAVEHHGAALELLRSAGDVTTECEMTSDYGETLRQLGRLTEARQHFERALRLADRTDQRYQRGRALDGLARIMEPDDPAAARSLRASARAVFGQLGVPEADEIDARLPARRHDHRTAG